MHPRGCIFCSNIIQANSYLRRENVETDLMSAIFWCGKDFRRLVILEAIKKDAGK